MLFEATLPILTSYNLDEQVFSWKKFDEFVLFSWYLRKSK